MKYEKVKLFWKTYLDVRHIECIPYDDTVEYYTFLRDCRSKGYKQVVITSEIMIEIIRQECLKNGHIVSKIEFVEDDLDLSEEIDWILSKMVKNSGYLTELIDKLKFLAEKSSIDIKRIYIKSQYTESGTADYFIQTNGIIGVNKESIEKISQEMSTLVEGCLS